MLGNNTLATNIILLVKTWERGGGKKTRLNIFNFYIYIYLYNPGFGLKLQAY
jgi:hypothetical protein